MHFWIAASVLLLVGAGMLSFGADMLALDKCVFGPGWDACKQVFTH